MPRQRKLWTWVQKILRTHILVSLLYPSGFTLSATMSSCLCVFHQLNTIRRKNSSENAERTLKPNIYNHLSVNAATGIWPNPYKKTPDSLQRLKQGVSYDYTKTRLLQLKDKSVRAIRRDSEAEKKSDFSRCEVFFHYCPFPY